MSESIRERLKISADRLDDINTVLLNPDMGVINDFLAVVSKYGPPEEINRQLVSTVADLDFAPTPTAAENLIAEGVDRGRILVTGNTGIDALYQTIASLDPSEDGHPWIGAENPILTISEFSDYMCFQCKKMHFILRQLVQSYPDRIRMIHRHFPMDHAYNPLVKDPFHSGSGQMALIALYAQTKGQFWKVNDYLFGLASTKFRYKEKSS